MKANYMDKTNKLMRGALESEEAFKDALLEVLDSLGMTNPRAIAKGRGLLEHSVQDRQRRQVSQP